MVPFCDSVAPIAAQVGVERPDGAAAKDDGAEGGVVGDGVDDLARHLGAVVDDLQRGLHEFGRSAAHRERDSRRRCRSWPMTKASSTSSRGLMKVPAGMPRAVVEQGVVEDHAIVRLGHLRRPAAWRGWSGRSCGPTIFAPRAIRASAQRRCTS